MTEDRCPSCRADLRGEEIPAEYRRESGPTHYSNVIGVEVWGVYDGVLYWLCPVCSHKWHRFPEGHHLRERAEQYVSRGPAVAVAS